MSRKLEAKSSHGKAGRPRGPVPRPHIQVPRDELWPLGDIAAEFGISTRSADAVKTPTQRRGGR
jgi:hypothetical protein